MIGVAIVNFRTGEYIEPCLRSLVAATSLPLRVAIVDNESRDGSVSAIRRALAAHRGRLDGRLVEASANRGFAAGCNLAIRELLSDSAVRHVLLLNPDTEAEPRSLDALADFLDQKRTAGVVGGRCVGVDGSVQHTAFRFPSLATEFLEGRKVPLSDHGAARFAITAPMKDCAHRTDWVEASCMMIRREVLETVGLLDESYFLYFEEPDLCRRAAAAGWTCWYVPMCRVLHHKGAATGLPLPSGEAVPPLPAWFDSRRRYFCVHNGALYLLAADIARRAGMVLWRRHCRKLDFPDPVAPAVYAAFAQNTFPRRRARA